MGRKVISQSRNALLRRGDGGVYDAKGAKRGRDATEGGVFWAPLRDGRAAMELSRFMAEDDMPRRRRRRRVMSRRRGP